MATLTDITQLAAATAWRGRRIDPTGFYDLGARYYEPTSGRFLSADPMGQSASPSLYDFAGGDPVNLFDPTGRCNNETNTPHLNAPTYPSGPIPNFNDPSDNGQNPTDPNRHGAYQGILDYINMTPGMAVTPIFANNGQFLCYYVHDMSAEFQQLFQGLADSISYKMQADIDSMTPRDGPPIGALLTLAVAVAADGLGSQFLMPDLAGENTSLQIGYHATNPANVDSILSEGLNDSTEGRLGGGGVYVNNTPAGAAAEYVAHNQSGPSPALLTVEYDPGTNYYISPTPTNFTPGPLPLAGDTLTTESIRSPGTYNTIIRNGSAIVVPPR